MKKADLLVSLICVEVALCVSYLTLLSRWSEISKVIVLMLSSFVCLSAALLAIRGWLDTLSTTRLPGGSNRLRRLVEAEKKILEAGKTKTSKKCGHPWCWCHYEEED